MTNPSSDTRQVIVTGATGFVGRHLVPLLLARGYDVVAMARDEGKARELDWFEHVHFVPFDLRAAAPSLKPKPGARLVHLAWPGLPNYSSRFHFEENLPYSYAFIKGLIATGIGQVLVTGTCFEYGMQNGPLASTTQPRPTNAYGFAKDALRLQLDFLRAETPFTLQWARLFYMYGKGQHPHTLFAQLDAAIDRGDSVFNMSGGEQLRDYLPVTDAATRLVDLLESRRGGVFNVCQGEPVSIRNLVDRRIAERGASTVKNLGYYSYPDYEPMAFWGVPDPIESA